MEAHQIKWTSKINCCEASEIYISYRLELLWRGSFGRFLGICDGPIGLVVRRHGGVRNVRGYIRRTRTAMFAPRGSAEISSHAELEPRPVYGHTADFPFSQPQSAATLPLTPALGSCTAINLQGPRNTPTPSFYNTS